MSKQGEKIRGRIPVSYVVAAGLAVLGIGLSGPWAWKIVEACSPPPSYPSTDIFLDRDTSEGSYSLSPDYTSYSVGTQVEMTATGKVYTDYDYVLDYWEGLSTDDFPSGPGGPGTSSDNPVTTTVTTIDLQQTFPATGQKKPKWKIRYRLTTDVVGQGDVDPGGGMRLANTWYTLTATPDPGWQFDHWEDDLTGTTNPQDIYMDEPKHVTAVFVPISTVTVGLASITPVTIAEGASTNLTLNASTGTHGGFTVDLSVGVCSPSADATDYSVPAQVVFPANTPSVAVNVSAVQDLVDEHDECFTVNLSQISAGTATIDPAAASVQVTIQDDDASPTLNFELETSSAGENAGVASVKVLLSNPSSEDIDLTFLTGGTSTPGIGGDYLITASPMTIPAASTEAFIELAIADDLMDEPDETAILTLQSATCPTLSASIGTPVTHTLTLTDNDAPPVAEFAVGASPVAEDGVFASLTVNLSNPSSEDVTLTYSVGGSATPGAGEDFTIAGTQLVIPAESITGSITVDVNDDSLDEADETVVVTLESATCPTLSASIGAPAAHTLTIADNDASPVVQFAASTSSVSEDGVSASLTVNLSNASSEDITLTYSVGGSATTGAGEDYTIAASPLVIPAGATSGSVEVTVNNDTVDEADETVVVTLLTASCPTLSASIGATAAHTLTLTDDDAPPEAVFALSASSSPENGVAASLTVNLSNASSEEVTLTYSVGGSAIPGAGADYTITGSPLVIPAGSTSGDIIVTLNDDSLDEADETVVVTLQTATCPTLTATIGTPAAHTLLLTDNDPSPVAEFTVSESSVAEDGVSASLTVNLSNPSSEDVTLTYSVGGTATEGAGEDYTIAASPLVIPAGTTAGAVAVTINEDYFDEVDETVVVTLETASCPTLAASIGPNAIHTLTITDNDTGPTAAFSASPVSGVAPLNVSFTDGSTPGSAPSITGWAWDFDNDGTPDSTLQNPSHNYTNPGIYTVKLTVTTAGGSDFETKENYIRAGLVNLTEPPDGTFGELYKDLIPADTLVSEYDADRFSVLTGLVVDAGGSPISGVAVNALHHAEYGTAYTDASGRYGLPVEGGDSMVAVFTKQGLITSHRRVQVPWNDTAIVDAVTMLAEDSASTVITLDGNPNSVFSHRSSTTSDSDGTRACTVVLTGDTVVNEVDADGNLVQQLTSFTTRATEFTTKQSMPAELPPTSAYTYCVELSIDGADYVQFSKPVVMWNENFIGYSVGELIPVGFYDRDAGVWKPENDGVVVRLLDTDSNGTVDALDGTGDGVADDLDGDTQTADEVAGLNNTQLYAVGATFWRTEVTHFSPWDCNNPYGPPGDGIPPTGKGGPSSSEDGDGANGDTDRFGYVTHRGRAFHEDIPVAGTGLTLHYASDRTDGFETVFTIPVSDDAELPASLKEMKAIVEIGGRVLEQSLTPAVNQTAEIGWDGLDWLGRALPEARANVRVEFIYDAVLWSAGGLNPAQQTQSFGDPGVSATLIAARQEFVFTKRFDPIQVITGKRPDTLATGWTLSNHHNLSTRGRPMLRRGDGEIVAHPAWVINTVPGTGHPDDTNPIAFSNNQGIAVDAAGNLYAVDTTLHRVYVVDRSGASDTVAGTTSGYFGDGDFAIYAKMNSPKDVAVDTQGRVFIADTNNDRIRMVDLDGIITTVAGSTNGYEGDGGPATLAKLNRPNGVLVDAEGNIFIADTNNHRVRKVSPSGIITTYGGNGQTGVNVLDGGLATNARIQNPRDLAMDAAGNLYIACATVYRVRKIDTAGIITTVAGTGTFGATSGDGENGLATEADLRGPQAVAVDRGGNLYLTEDSRIRRVDVSGIITTFAGTGTAGFTGDGNLAQLARVNGNCYGLAVDSLSNLYISDNGNHVVRRVGSGLVDFENSLENGEYTFAEANGLAHVTDATGKHLRTVDQATGATLLTYAYNQDGGLESVTDLHDEALTIVRNQQGVPTSIVSPDGITTQLTVNGAGQLTGVAYPDGGSYTMNYDAGGLLEDISANGRLYDNTYDTFGRVDSVQDPLLKTWNFDGQQGQLDADAYSATTPEQDTVSYETKTLPSGAVQSTITDAAGLETTYEQGAGELSEKLTLPTGSEISANYGIDPVFHFKKTDSILAHMPSGLESETAFDVQYTDTDQDDVHDRITYTQTIQPGAADERVWTVVDDTLAGTVTATSPENRVSTVNYDPSTLLVSSSEVPGLYDVAYQYDTRGRLTTNTVSTRSVTFTYDLDGNLDTVSEPVTGTVAFDYDGVGRLTQITQPDQTTTIGFDYDLDGNLESITLPGQITHSFGYDDLNRNTSYTTPLSRQYTYTYDDSHRLTQVGLPSTTAIQYNYSLGRLDSVVTPDGTTSIAYDNAGRVYTVSRGSESATFGYDGDLLTSRTLSGTLNQTLSLAYDDDFSVESVTYAGEMETFTYDDDDLLTGAGDFTISRNVQNGLPESVTDGTAMVTRTINGYGEVTGVATVVNGTTVSWSTTLDNAGRITAKTENVGGTTTTYAYTYDTLGHLETVTKNGVLDEDYTVDNKGRRILDTVTSRSISNRSLTYDNEDRMLTAGSASYTYDDDGYLATKTVGQDVTTYTYSRNGALKSVSLPSTDVIDYVLDAGEQRIAKKVNSVVTEKYLWAGMTRLLAVYDELDNLVARFEYADGPLPIKMVQGVSEYYLAYDQVGSLRAVIDTGGNIVHEITYDSFGNILTETSSSLLIPFGFAGGLHDRDTGLVRFGYRDYDPDSGRWTAKDPVGFLAGDWNIYEYCGSDPTNFVDPTGLETFLTSWIPTDWLWTASNFSAGAGDTVSWGATQAFREWQMGGDIVDTSSGAYKIGVGVATTAEIATGVGGALKGGSKLAARTAIKNAADDVGCFVSGTPILTPEGRQPIEEIHLGQRVTTSNPETALTEVDPETWRRVDLTLFHKGDPDNSFEIATLKPLDWIDTYGSSVGAIVYFALPDIGIEGPSRIDAIGPCPEIHEGPGSVVLSTISSCSSNVLRIAFDAKLDVVDVTATHRFYSIDRDGWLPASALQSGGRVQTLEGSAVVTQIMTLSDTQLVHNLEVEGEHCYFAGSESVLVHNACLATKIVRNPFGRRGGPTHRARIGQIEKRFQKSGWDTVSGGSLPERKFGNRFPDLVLQKGDKRIAFQVGKTTKAGNPIARERRALQDIRSLGQFNHVFYLTH